ncbi:MAG TPA: sigma-70 family RNA polymerase sigma factor [Kofleriaceae bacterium]|nr:sigma-70 family RNA polymerase sigma factor [Kofleriaceae bacterium]
MTAHDARAAVAQDDLALARRCASGDAAAQRQLFRDTRGLVHRTLFRILGSNRDMEDLVQEVYIEVFRSLARFRGEAKLATWIARITTRVALAAIRRRRPAASSLDVVPEPASGAPGAAEVLEMRQAAARLYAVLDRVDPVQRIAFALHVIEGLPLREVAEITDASLVATKSRVWRARREVERRAGRDPVLAELLAAGRTR